MNRKGITPVISVVLLIMLTVAITGGAYYWMTNVQSSLQENVGASIQGSAELATASFSIVSVSCDSTTEEIKIIGLNTGTQTLDASKAIITISSIEGSVLGTLVDLNGGASISPGGSFTVTTSDETWDLASGTAYSARLNIGSSAQTATCTAK